MESPSEKPTSRLRGTIVLILVFVIPLALAVSTALLARPGTQQAMEGAKRTQDACYEAATREAPDATVEPPRELGSTGQWAGRLEYDDGRRAMYRCRPDGTEYSVVIAEH
jgi:hypothetical protein